MAKNGKLTLLDEDGSSLDSEFHSKPVLPPASPLHHHTERLPAGEAPHRAPDPYACIGRSMTERSSISQSTSLRSSSLSATRPSLSRPPRLHPRPWPIWEPSARSARSALLLSGAQPDLPARPAPSQRTTPLPPTLTSCGTRQLCSREQLLLEVGPRWDAGADARVLLHTQVPAWGDQERSACPRSYSGTAKATTKASEPAFRFQDGPGRAMHDSNSHNFGVRMVRGNRLLPV